MGRTPSMLPKTDLRQRDGRNDRADRRGRLLVQRHELGPNGESLLKSLQQRLDLTTIYSMDDRAEAEALTPRSDDGGGPLRTLEVTLRRHSP
jgi:hypothetical protein